MEGGNGGGKLGGKDWVVASDRADRAYDRESVILCVCARVCACTHRDACTHTYASA